GGPDFRLIGHRRKLSCSVIIEDRNPKRVAKTLTLAFIEHFSAVPSSNHATGLWQISPRQGFTCYEFEHTAESVDGHGRVLSYEFQNFVHGGRSHFIRVYEQEICETQKNSPAKRLLLPYVAFR